MSNSHNHTSSRPASSKRRLLEPTSPSQELVSSDMGFLGGNNLLYMVIGAAGVSMGISVFLYREMKKLKSDVETIQIKTSKDTKEQFEANSETIKSIDMKINQLAQNMQGLHMYVRNTATTNGKPLPPKPKPLPKPLSKPIGSNLPKPEGVSKVIITSGGPNDPQPVVSAEKSSEEPNAICDPDTGVCTITETEEDLDSDSDFDKTLEV